MSAEMSMAFERAHGVYQIPVPSGESITAISQPSWSDFMHSLGHVASSRDVGAFIATPELMTSPDIDLSDVSQQRTLIEDRVGEVSEVMRQLPDTTLLLGTILFDESVEKPRNAVLFLRNGVEVGRTHKVFSFNRDEREYLYMAPRSDTVIAKPAPDVVNLICSDLANPPAIDEDVAVLLVSGCWGAPARHPWMTEISDDDKIGFLEGATRRLFDQYDNLQTIAMIDRVPMGSISDPFNFVAQRQ
jgi:hypothetical protein